MKHSRIRKQEKQQGRSNGWRLLLVLVSTLTASQNVEGFLYPPSQKVHSMPLLFATQAPHRRRPGGPSPKRSTTLFKRRKRPTEHPPGKRKRGKRRNTFSVMFERLKEYSNEHGHCLVSSDHDDAELYKWTRSIRKNYKHQFTQQVRAKKPSGGKKEHKTRRPMLSEHRVQLLQSVQFCWDVQEAVWQQKYDQLSGFYHTYGHASPVEDPALAVWLQNQRRDYRLWLQDLPNSLTPERLEALEELGVLEDYKTQRQVWAQHYQYLVEFHQKVGHTNVPQNYRHQVTITVLDADQQLQKRQTTFALGQWCMNQRTAKKRWDALQEDNQNSNGKESKPTKQKSKKKKEKSSDANHKQIITAERIRLLNVLDFSWNVRDTKWHSLLQRLQAYHQTHGHLKIPTNDATNQDLRNWLIAQRHYYQRQRLPFQSSPMTLERIDAIETSIPDFPWKGRARGGPSTEDWSNLFNAMRDKGIAPDSKPKQHWFEGQNPLQGEVKSEWTEQELIDLWHQDGEEEEGEEEDGEDVLANGGFNYFVDMEEATSPGPAEIQMPPSKSKATRSRNSRFSALLEYTQQDDDDEDDEEEDMFANGGGFKNYFVDMEEAANPSTM